MMKWIGRPFIKKQLKDRRGSSTIEFIIILPLFLMLVLFVWQAAVAGMAVISTQAALRDAVRVAATTGDAEKAKQQAYASFGQSGDYRLKKVNVVIDGRDGKAIVEGETDIDVLFISSSSPFHYSNKVEAPLFD